jgi:hypothetical protein
MWQVRPLFFAGMNRRGRRCDKTDQDDHAGWLRRASRPASAAHKESQFLAAERSSGYDLAIMSH